MDLTNITQLLLQQIGLDHGTIGEASIELGVTARMQALRVNDVANYLARVIIDREELQALIEEVIVPETWFFRGFDQLRYMAEVGSQWRPSFPGHSLRVLSIPCSSGEEPYSIYMFLRHHGLEPSQIRIVAADISQRSIDRATRGVYGDLSFRETGPLCDVLRHRFFERDSNQTVIPEVRSAVQFRQDNLVSPTFLVDAGVFDMIFCRNLLIYFDQPSRQFALQSLQRLLAPNGYVFGGHAEQLAMIDPQLQSVGPAGAFAYQRADVANNAARPSPLPLRNPPPSIPPAREPAFRSAFAPDVSGTALAADFSPETSTSRQLARPVASAIPLTKSTIQDLLASAEQAANSGQLSDARSLCARHLEQHGPTASAMCLMGVIQNAAGELADAEKSFQKAVYLDPAHKDSLWHLKLLAEKRGDQRAVETLNRRLARAMSSD